MHNQYRVTVENQEYDVWRDSVRRINKQMRHATHTLAPKHDAEEIARVKAALRAQYEKKAAKVATMRLSTLRSQILKESKKPWLGGYDFYLHCCYGLQIDVAAGVVWQVWQPGDDACDKTRYSVSLPGYWHTRIAHAREITPSE